MRPNKRRRRLGDEARVPPQRRALELRRLSLRIQTDELERLGERQVAGFPRGEFGVEDPLALDCPPESVPVVPPCAVTALPVRPDGRLSLLR